MKHARSGSAVLITIYLLGLMGTLAQQTINDASPLAITSVFRKISLVERKTTFQNGLVLAAAMLSLTDSNEIPEDMKEVMAQFENSDIAHIDPDNVLSQLPPEMAHMVQEQMKEFEKNPELLWQSMRDLFK